MLEGVDNPGTLEGSVVAPQALIKLKETIIKNFFIDISDYVIMIKGNIKILGICCRIRKRVVVYEN